MNERSPRPALLAAIEKSEWLLLLLEAIPEGIVVCAEDGRVIFWNQWAEEITGFSKDQAREGALAEIMLCEPDGASGSEEVSSRRLPIKRQNGQEGMLSIRSSRLEIPDGDSYIIHAFSDISESAHDQDAVQLVNDLLFEATQRMQDQVNTDGLTGLLNHGAFQDRTREMISAMKRYRRDLSLVMFDVDLFKNVNDTHGHQFGDKVLRAIAAAAREISREEDIAARYGGEEFTLTLPDTSKEGARRLAERLRVAVETLVITEGRIEQQVTVSCGVGYLNPATDIGDSEELAHTLIGRADEALYIAKNAGRNRVAVYVEE